MIEFHSDWIRFHLLDFLAPLSPPTLIMAVILGISMGAVLVATHHRLTTITVFWQLAGGAIFFIPLSLLRAFQGSEIWERFLATLVLWIIFVLGMWLGARVFNARK